ncbi:hypothetical protein COOONC_03127 [Cooperia oncophora]
MDNDDQSLIEQRRQFRNLSDQYPEAYDVLLFTIDKFRPKPLIPTAGDSVRAEWGPRMPNDVVGATPRPTRATISPGGPPPMPDGGDPRSPFRPQGSSLGMAGGADPRSNLAAK